MKKNTDDIDELKKQMRKMKKEIDEMRDEIRDLKRRTCTAEELKQKAEDIRKAIRRSAR